MEKRELLSLITKAATDKLVTKEEVISAFEEGSKTPGRILNKQLGISEVLYFIGGFIVFIGIAVLIFQNWSQLNSAVKILVTLGFGVMAYLLGVLLSKEEKYGAIGYAFHLIAALVTPLGLGVVFNLSGFDSTRPGIQVLISGILFAVYFNSYFIFKKPIFTFFAIIFGTWLFFSATNYLIGGNPYFADIKFAEYRILGVGVTYMLLGYYFTSTVQRGLTGSLYGFGALFFLGAALALGGWKPNQNIIWEILFPLLVSGILFLSVNLKTKALLTFGTIFLMAYILKITGEYFSGTLGWPLSLVICGIVLIGIGYYAFTINKKYLATK